MRHIPPMEFGDRIQERLDQRDAVVPPDLLSRPLQKIRQRHPPLWQAAEIEVLR
jgi:hypothetical protein